MAEEALLALSQNPSPRWMWTAPRCGVTSSPSSAATRVQDGPTGMGRPALPRCPGFVPPSNHGVPHKTRPPPPPMGNVSHVSLPQARGLAHLADLRFEAVPPFQFQGIRLRRFVQAPLVPTRCRLPELEHYCTACPAQRYFGRWFHECAAAWMGLDVGEELRRAIGLQTGPWQRRDIVIQLRCGDSHKHPNYGMLPFRCWRRRGSVERAVVGAG